MNIQSFIKNKINTILLIIGGIISSNMVYAEISVLDDIGHKITLKTPAKNIISLSPGLTELVFSAGGGEYLKGVVSYSNYPEAANDIPQVGSYNAVDIEKIVALNPDLILSWESGNPSMQISMLKKLGLNVFTSKPRDFSDVPSTIQRLGILMNTASLAQASAKNFNTRLENLKKRFPKTNHKKSVFVQIWDKPLMSISGEHLISKIVEQCNGENIFNKVKQLTVSLDIETVIQKDPDIILATREGNLGNSWLSQWKQWDFLTSVKNNRLYTVNPDYVVRHTPRILDGIEQVCSFIHSK